MSLTGQTPQAVCGPFMPDIQTFGTQTRLKLKGPVDLAPHHQIACCTFCRDVSCYELRDLADYAIYGPNRLEAQPIAGPSSNLLDSSSFLRPDSMIVFDQDSILLDTMDASVRDSSISKVPPKSKRAPRKCLICQSSTCKGRGIRSMCPQYDPANDEHLSRAGKRKRVSMANQQASTTANQLDPALDVDLHASPNLHLIDDMFTARDMPSPLFDLQ